MNSDSNRYALEGEAEKQLTAELTQLFQGLQEQRLTHLSTLGTFAAHLKGTPDWHSTIRRRLTDAVAKYLCAVLKPQLEDPCGDATVDTLLAPRKYAVSPESGYELTISDDGPSALETERAEFEAGRSPIWAALEKAAVLGGFSSFDTDKSLRDAVGPPSVNWDTVRARLETDLRSGATVQNDRDLAPVPIVFQPLEGDAPKILHPPMPQPSTPDAEYERRWFCNFYPLSSAPEWRDPLSTDALWGRICHLPQGELVMRPQFRSLSRPKYTLAKEWKFSDYEVRAIAAVGRNSAAGYPCQFLAATHQMESCLRQNPATRDHVLAFWDTVQVSTALHDLEAQLILENPSDHWGIKGALLWLKCRLGEYLDAIEHTPCPADLDAVSPTGAVAIEYFAPTGGAARSDSPAVEHRLNRATWLHQELRKRGWSAEDVAKFGNGTPSAKTVRKILRGEQVKNAVLLRLAAVLSKFHAEKGGYLKVDVNDIPEP